MKDEYLLIMSFHPEKPINEKDRLKFSYRTQIRKKVN